MRPRLPACLPGLPGSTSLRPTSSSVGANTGSTIFRGKFSTANKRRNKLARVRRKFSRNEAEEGRRGKGRGGREGGRRFMALRRRSPVPDLFVYAPRPRRLATCNGERRRSQRPTDRDRRVQGERGNQGLQGECRVRRREFIRGVILPPPFQMARATLQIVSIICPYFMALTPSANLPSPPGCPPRSSNKCPNTFAAVPPCAFFCNRRFTGATAAPPRGRAPAATGLVAANFMGL